jgi:hypothetical protein
MTTKEIIAAAGDSGGARYLSDKALWLTEDARVVELGDTEARYVLVGEGGNLPLGVAQALGLTGTKKEQSEAKATIEAGESLTTFPVVRASDSTK